MRAIITSAFLAACVALTVSGAAAAEPMKKAAAAAPASKAKALLNGKWKFDPAASKFASGREIASETRIYEVDGDKVRMTSNGTDPAGNAMNISYSAAYDGKYYPMTGNPVADSIALKRVDDRTVEATVRKGEAISGHAKVVVSPDGNRLTMTRKLMRENAEPAVDELVFVRQD